MTSPRLFVGHEGGLLVAGGTGARRCRARRVVLGDGLLDELLGERRLLGVRALVRGERGLHPDHAGRVVEVQFRRLFQAAGRAFLHADQAALTVGRAYRVAPVLPGVAHYAHVRADEVAVVAPVADPAA